MLNQIAVEWIQIILFVSAATALLTAGGIQLSKAKSRSAGLIGSARLSAGMPVPKIVGVARPNIRSFVPKIDGVSQFKKSAQIKYGQACVTSQRLLMAMRREMASHGVTPPDELSA